MVVFKSVPATNPAMLKDFYAEKPNHLTSLSQQPLMTAWYAFPGDNNLKIIQVIKDRLQTVVDKSAAPDADTLSGVGSMRARNVLNSGSVIFCNEGGYIARKSRPSRNRVSCGNSIAINWSLIRKRASARISVTSQSTA